MNSLKSVIPLAAALALLIIGGPATGEEVATPHELLERAIESIPEVSFRAALRLSSHGLTRDLDLAQRKLSDEIYGTYLEVTAPHDVKDTRFLFREHLKGRDEQFVYIPALRRAIQVGEQSREQPFLGSEFYVSDMVAPAPESFDLRYVGAAEALGRSCRLVKAVPKNPDDWAYGKAVYTVDPADQLILRAEFFDKEGRLLKVWTVEKLEKVGEFWTPGLQKMTNVQEGVVSTLELLKIEYGVEIPERVFSREHLMR